MLVGGHFTLNFLIDSGACANVITLKDWRRLRNSKDASIIDFTWGNCRPLKAINKTEVKVLGRFTASFEVCEAKRPTTYAEFIIVNEAIDNVISFKTARELKILKVGLEETEAIRLIKEQSEKFPTIPGFKYRLSINEKVPPVRNTSYFIPLAFEEDLDEQMWELQQKGIIEPAKIDSPWCHRLDSVRKADGTQRPIVDMRPANKAIYRDVFPMPYVETLTPRLAGARYFTKLDLKSAFYHIELHEDSRYITTFMTKRGMMQFTRLPFGINVAPEVFQRTLQEILNSCEGCVNYIDDVLIYGKTKEELHKNTDKVLDQLKANSLTLNHEKCEYELEEVTFLGCKITKDGIEPTIEKMNAISKFRAPKSTTELRSFIGLANFVSESVRNFSSLTEPLRHLLRDKEPWSWTEKEETAFQKMKQVITEETKPRAFFRRDCETSLITDASPWAIGAVLAQRQKDETTGQMKTVTIACASKSLTATERRYYQTHRELLAIVWAVEKFTFFLIGTKFTVMTDHDPLQEILLRSKASNKRMATRFEGWSMRLAPYDFDVKRVSSKENVADAMSRLYEGNDTEFNVDQENQLLFAISQDEDDQTLRVSHQELKEAAENCQTIKAIKASLLSGEWPKELRRFELMEQELEVEDEFIIRQGRFIPPESLKIKIINIAHSSHASASTMKRLIRDRFWWPLMDVEINNKYENCEVCQQLAAPPKPLPLHSTVQPSRPWEYIALDHFSALYDKITILVIQDYFSRFLITRFVETIDVKATITLLDEIFRVYGIPSKIRTDQGRTWIAAEFKEYCKNLGITTETSAPYAQWQNGLVERAMRTVKRAATTAIVARDSKRALGAQVSDQETKKELRLRVKRAIYVYNRTPHSTTEKAPTEMMWGRKSTDLFPISRDDELTEETRNGWPAFLQNDQEQRNKSIDKANEKRKPSQQSIEPGDIVLIKNHALGKLLPNFGLRRFEVIAIKGVNVVLTDNNGRTFERYAQHVKRVGHIKNSSTEGGTEDETTALPAELTTDPYVEPAVKEFANPSDPISDPTSDPTSDATTSNDASAGYEDQQPAKRRRTTKSPITLRRSTRDHVKPSRYSPE